MTYEIELNLTPLMKQYQEIKAQYPDTLLMFRLGDFYELFGEDAIKSSPILGVVLTKRQSVPMCGVPFHSVNHYIAKLLSTGHKVAICEQIEDAKLAKGIVKREVVRVITPGTILEDYILPPKKNNYLTGLKLSFVKNDIYIGVASIDVSTGDFIITQFKDNNLVKIVDELTRLSPAEIVIPEGEKKYFEPIASIFQNVHIEYLEDWYFDPSTAEEKIKQIFKIQSIESFGIKPEQHTIAISASGGIIEYITLTQKNFIPQIKGLRFYSIEDFMVLDATCIRNLELVENLYDRTVKNTLLDVLDETVTSLGGRLLRNWILKPLLNITEIKNRQKLVLLFFEDEHLRNNVRKKLKLFPDIERIVNRISTKTVNPKEIISLLDALKTIPEIKILITESLSYSKLIPEEYPTITEIPELKELIELIEKSIEPEPSSDIKKGNVIKKGFSQELDELREFYSSGKTWLLKYQEEQRQKTNIQSLKVGYTSVFGYYIEVTKSNLHLVPQEYIRKQTLKNVERFVTKELKEFEDKILSCEEKILQLETQLFNDILNEINKYSTELFEISSKISLIDVVSTLAEVAKKYKYTKPEIDDSGVIELKLCRHPVVEQILPPGKFVPNDLYIDGKDPQVIIITGPNMAGKSTYIRQVALNVIMAQMGSFVPCESAQIGVVDRIFTRIGASDYLARGLSTFMVEMQETANILHNATNKSLVILDEIGRGTSTFDGISIAWSCIEYLVTKNNFQNNTDSIGPKVLFATHYFELTELESKYKCIKNFNVAVKEYKDQIIFLYKIQPGCSDKSYGIQVAQLAGVPKNVILRAKELLKFLQQHTSDFEKLDKSMQLEFLFDVPFSEEKFFILELLEEIKKIDINNTTPIEALNKILIWKKKLTQQNDKNIKE